VNHDFAPSSRPVENAKYHVRYRRAVIFLEPALKALLPPGKFHRHILLLKRG
jgi:hypothetical protein